MTPRTKSQSLANRIDLELSRLLGAAETQSGLHWASLTTALRRARTHVRIEMHPEDRVTSGGELQETN